MAFTYGFYNSINGDRRYDAQQMSAIFDGIITDGVFSSVGGIFATVPGEGMTVVVKSGRAWFDHTWSYNDGAMPLSIQAADVTLKRYDAVVLEVNNTESVRENAIKVIKGTPATNPVKPGMTNTETVHQHPLAYVLIDPGVTSITADKIDIRVGQSDCPFSTAILQTVSITDLFNAWESEFDQWFANVQAQLEGNVVTNLQKQIDDRVKIADKATSADLAAATPNKWVDAAGLKEGMIAEASKMLIQIFTTTTSWKAPVTGKAIVIALGGGGGGGCGAASGSTVGYGPAGGGGGSGRINIGEGTIVKNTSYAITVGAGGIGGSKSGTVSTPSAGSPGNDGGSSSALSISASGGSGGGAGSPNQGGRGGNGGSGGGGGGIAKGFVNDDSTIYIGGDGGNGEFGGGGGGGGCAYNWLRDKGKGGNGGKGGTYGGGGGGGCGGGGSASYMGKSGSGGLYGGNGGYSKASPNGLDGKLIINNLLRNVFNLEFEFPFGGSSGLSTSGSAVSEYGFGGGGGSGAQGKDRSSKENDAGGGGGGGIGYLKQNKEGTVSSRHYAFYGGEGGSWTAGNDKTTGGEGGYGIPIRRYNNQLPIYKGSGGNGSRGATTTFTAGNNGEDGLVAICYWEE